jgi:predicted protein tyrosine phosphatase
MSVALGKLLRLLAATAAEARRMALRLGLSARMFSRWHSIQVTDFDSAGLLDISNDPSSNDSLNQSRAIVVFPNRYSKASLLHHEA